MADSPSRGSRSRRIVFRSFLALVVGAVLLAPVVGMALAQGGSYVVEQGPTCTSITPIEGQQSPFAFYDYETPYENNTYSNSTGYAYSSLGTTHLQRQNTSILFLYEGPRGDVSLVMVHGTYEPNRVGTDGGSASFDIRGLPASGTWAVKDDQHPGTEDVWNHTATTADIDWTWHGNATDGGVYAGLGDDFSVTIDPAFNREAALFGEKYNGTVASWEALSAGIGGPDRTPLDLAQPVTVSTGSC